MNHTRKIRVVFVCQLSQIVFHDTPVNVTPWAPGLCAVLPACRPSGTESFCKHAGERNDSTEYNRHSKIQSQLILSDPFARRVTLQ